MVDRQDRGESAERERAMEAAPPREGTSNESAPAEGTPSLTPPPIAATRAGRRLARRPMSRRSVLRLGFWAGLGVATAGTLAITADLFYPRGVRGFGAEVVAGNLDEFPSGSKTAITEGRFWLANLTEEQGGPGLLALWWKCPHLGCTVPWRADFVWPEPETGQDKTGWFRCPCHGSTFTDAGVRVYGPSARSMDTMALRIDENDRVMVDTGDITPGSPDNAQRALRL